MIDPVSSQLPSLQLLRPSGPPDDPAPVEGPRLGPALDLGRAAGTEKPASFSDLVGGLVHAVDEKARAADGEVRKLMLGESDNIHRSMIAMQEAGIAFNLLVEVRNKLVESYQELMRMPV